MLQLTVAVNGITKEGQGRIDAGRDTTTVAVKGAEIPMVDLGSLDTIVNVEERAGHGEAIESQVQLQDVEHRNSSQIPRQNRVRGSPRNTVRAIADARGTLGGTISRSKEAGHVPEIGFVRRLGTVKMGSVKVLLEAGDGLAVEWRHGGKRILLLKALCFGTVVRKVRRSVDCDKPPIKSESAGLRTRRIQTDRGIATVRNAHSWINLDRRGTIPPTLEGSVHQDIVEDMEMSTGLYSG